MFLTQNLGKKKKNLLLIDNIPLITNLIIVQSRVNSTACGSNVRANHRAILRRVWPRDIRRRGNTHAVMRAGSRQLSRIGHDVRVGRRWRQPLHVRCPGVDAACPSARVGKSVCVEPCPWPVWGGGCGYLDVFAVAIGCEGIPCSIPVLVGARLADAHEGEGL